MKRSPEDDARDARAAGRTGRLNFLRGVLCDMDGSLRPERFKQVIAAALKLHPLLQMVRVAISAGTVAKMPRINWGMDKQFSTLTFDCVSYTGAVELDFKSKTLVDDAIVAMAAPIGLVLMSAVNVDEESRHSMVCSLWPKTTVKDRLKSIILLIYKHVDVEITERGEQPHLQFVVRFDVKSEARPDDS